MAICFIAVSTFAFTGCRTGGFSKPDMSKLAFWKKNDNLAANTPPPPARHFDPSPIEGETMNGSINDGSKDQLVELNGAGLRDRYESSADKARTEINSSLAGLGKSLGSKQPIRKPYSSSSSDSSDLANMSTAVRSKLDNFESSMDSKSNSALSTAQQEFQAAMGGSIASNKVESKTDFNSTNEFAPTNSFAARAAEATKDTTKVWKDIPLPTGISSAASSINQSLAKAADATYDANGRLTNSVDKVKDSFIARANELKTNASSAVASNGFGANEANSNGFGTTASQNSYAANNSASGSGFGTPTSQPFGSATTTPETASSSASQELMSQVADAKMQIAQLKLQVAEAQRLAAQKLASSPPPNQFQTDAKPFQPQPKFPSQTQAPVAQVAQLQTPGFSSQTSSMGMASTNSTLPNNVLRSAADSLRTSTPATPPANNFAPSYPTTGMDRFGSSNDFSSKTTPPNPMTGSQVSFQSNTGNAGSAVQQSSEVAASNSFYSNGGVSNSATRIQNHVSEIDIPESILKGVGSYAPGSVNSLNSK
ncbi:MAG: hypothetical protein AB8B55_23915 [Mariniblastus sp.]